MSGNIGVAAGCNYTGNGDGAGVAIVSGAGLIADEVIAELETEAEAQGAEVASIDVGDGGRAFGSPMRSEAATKADGKIVQVEIFAEGTEADRRQVGRGRRAARAVRRPQRLTRFAADADT